MSDSKNEEWEIVVFNDRSPNCCETDPVMKDPNSWEHVRFFCPCTFSRFDPKATGRGPTAEARRLSARRFGGNSIIDDGKSTIEAPNAMICLPPWSICLPDNWVRPSVSPDDRFVTPDDQGVLPDDRFVHHDDRLLPR